MAPDMDRRIEGIEGDLKVLKAEIKSTLIDLRDHLARRESPVGGGPSRQSPRESVQQVTLPSQGHEPQQQIRRQAPQTAPDPGPWPSPPAVHPQMMAPAVAQPQTYSPALAVAQALVPRGTQQQPLAAPPPTSLCVPPHPRAAPPVRHPAWPRPPQSPKWGC